MTQEAILRLLVAVLCVLFLIIGTQIDIGEPRIDEVHFSQEPYNDGILVWERNTVEGILLYGPNGMEYVPIRDYSIYLETKGAEFGE